MPLAPGDILFVGFDADNDDIAFITTTDLAAGEVIYFTDDEWDGTAFNGGEQYMEWTVPTGGVPAGTIVTIDMDRGNNTATISEGGNFDYMRGGYDIAGGNEMFWAFQGTRTGNTAVPDNFIAVIANEADGNYNRTPDLTGTGLTTSNGAIIIDGDEDYMEYTAEGGLPDPATRSDLLASVLDTANWTTADGGGNSNPNGTGFDFAFPTVLCFAAGTPIATDRGPRAVELLAPGDRVLTRDHGFRPLVWTGRRRVAARGRWAPVRFSAGAIGNEAPLVVSPQHRMLVTGWKAQLLTGLDEVLVPAKSLVNGTTVHRLTGGEVTYVHVMCDRHEILNATGCWSESLYPGEVARAGLDAAARAEILALFPELAAGTAAYGPPARPFAAAWEGRALAA